MVKILDASALVAYLWKQPGYEKMQDHKIPFVDCFAAALAKLRKGELITKDKDFKAVEGDVKIIWL